jgi:hypothetical protein
MQDKYFSYDPEAGFETHDSEEKAKAAAAESLQDYRDNAGEGWDELVEQVCWGEIKQITVMGEKTPAEHPEYDYLVDYALADTADA